MDSAICRICLNSSVTLVHIFAKRQQIHKGKPEPCLADMLNECADCHIKSNDTLTQHICLSCILSAQNAFRFKRMCEESYRQLVASAKCSLLNGSKKGLCIKQEQEITADEAPSEIDSNPSQRRTPTPTKVSQPRHELKRPRSTINQRPRRSSGSRQRTTTSSRRSRSRTPVPLPLPTANKSKQDESKETQKRAGVQQEPEPIAEEAQPSELSSKPYKCQMCGKQFAHMSILSLHKKWHLETKSSARIIAKPKLDKKSNRCTICEKKYATNQLLRRHIATHSTERPYACTICPTSFRLVTNLKRHMRNHTGERPFKCPWCAESFARSDYCRSHMEKAHSGRTFPGRLSRK
ncbi:zinc finger protein 358-like [Drosophila novamexicana]|uniref:zinc finger protein 358-like n=1 Tax=Drosophila novamexicana TaxID=47314 RepID=UPI0011E58E2F|nr:zinc finger protein 358-like [Drosophila novamexicana]